MNVVNLEQAFASVDELWSPHIAGMVNSTAIKLARVQGEFVWHHHDAEDELFLVVKGRLVMQFRDREVELGEGEFIVVPRGTEHRPVAPEEAWIMLVEPATTVNTGAERNDRTRLDLKHLA